MDYIEIDLNKIKGYAKLSEPAKQLFQRVYKKHNSAQGSEYKEKWIPTKLNEHKTYIEVHFRNGKWLHYLPNGTWY